MLGKAEGEVRRRAGEMDCRGVICCFCGKVLKCSCCALWSLMLVAVCGKWVVGVSSQRQCFFNLLKNLFFCVSKQQNQFDVMTEWGLKTIITDLKKSSFYLRVTNKFVVPLRIVMVKIRLLILLWGQHAEARTCLGLTLVNLSDGKTKAPDFHCFHFSV